MMLTAEQLAEGRRLFNASREASAAWRVPQAHMASEALKHWLEHNAEALLDAAERVTRLAERLRANELTADEICRGARAWGRACNDDAPDAGEDWAAWSDKLARVFDFAIDAARDAEDVGKPRPEPVEATREWPIEERRLVARSLREAADDVRREMQDVARASYRDFETDAELVKNELAAGQRLAVAGQIADAERANARAYFERLRPAFTLEFHTRPMVRDDQKVTNPHAFAPKHVRAWLESRGLQATVMINPSNPHDLLVDPLRVKFEHADAEA
jgi:hypothetical protein